MATATTEAPAVAETATKKGGKKKLILIVAVVLVVVLGAGYWFFLKPAPGPVEVPAPVPGPVLALETATINLQGAHYLKLGMSLQTSEASVADANLSGAKAQDLAIARFSGMSVDELSSAKGREAAKAALIADIVRAYDVEGQKAAEEKAAEAKKKNPKATPEKAKTGPPTEEELSSSQVYNVYFTEFVMQ